VVHIFTGDVEIYLRTFWLGLEESLVGARSPMHQGLDSCDPSIEGVKPPIQSVIARFFTNLLENMDKADKETVPLNMGYPEMMGDARIRARTSSSSMRMQNSSRSSGDDERDSFMSESGIVGTDTNTTGPRVPRRGRVVSVPKAAMSPKQAPKSPKTPL
jgi:hypothetical protein